MSDSNDKFRLEVRKVDLENAIQYFKNSAADAEVELNKVVEELKSFASDVVETAQAVAETVVETVKEEVKKATPKKAASKKADSKEETPAEETSVEEPKSDK
jgi:hypothetical protein